MEPKSFELMLVQIARFASERMGVASDRAWGDVKKQSAADIELAKEFWQA